MNQISVHSDNGDVSGVSYGGAVCSGLRATTAPPTVKVVHHHESQEESHHEIPLASENQPCQDQKHHDVNPEYEPCAILHGLIPSRSARVTGAWLRVPRIIASFDRRTE